MGLPPVPAPPPPDENSLCSGPLQQFTILSQSVVISTRGYSEAVAGTMPVRWADSRDAHGCEPGQ